MKRTVLLLMLLPLLALAQKVKINEYDKFIRQRRIEMEPVALMASSGASISLTYHCIGSTFYVLLSGHGWGVSSVSAESDLIFLLANDSTVSVRSTGVQMYEIGMPHNTFRHKYFISLADIGALSRHEVLGIRKYAVQDFAEMKVATSYAGPVKKLSSMFIQELKKGRVLLPLVDVEARDVAKHVGDSVRVCAKIYSTRYLDSSISRPAFLNVGANYPNQHLTVVIPEEERTKFSNIPEALYDQKKVCVCGVVQLVKEKPQIVVRNRAQMRIRTPIQLEEVPLYIDDSVTIYGKATASRNFPDVEGTPTLVYMGGGYPNHQLTVVMEGVQPRSAEERRDNFYAGKELVIEGKLVLAKGRPQLMVQHEDQVTVLGRSASEAMFASSKVEKPAPKTTPPGSAKNAQFPGGHTAWKEFLGKNIVFPEELEIGERKTVIAQVLIEKDGTPKVQNLVQSGGPAFDREVMRVLGKSPKWTPEVQNGSTIPISLMVPITFERVK